jgi:hypothetical protein
MNIPTITTTFSKIYAIGSTTGVASGYQTYFAESYLDDTSNIVVDHGRDASDTATASKPTTLLISR